MDKKTFETSAELVSGVTQEVWEYLDNLYPDDEWDKKDLLDSCDSAIQEIESWKKTLENDSAFTRDVKP